MKSSEASARYKSWKDVYFTVHQLYIKDKGGIWRDHTRLRQRTPICKF